MPGARQWHCVLLSRHRIQCHVLHDVLGSSYRMPDALPLLCHRSTNVGAITMQMKYSLPSSLIFLQRLLHLDSDVCQARPRSFFSICSPPSRRSDLPDMLVSQMPFGDSLISSTIDCSGSLGLLSLPTTGDISVVMSVFYYMERQRLCRYPHSVLVSLPEHLRLFDRHFAKSRLHYAVSIVFPPD